MPWKAEGSTGNKQNLNLSADAFTVMQMDELAFIGKENHSRFVSTVFENYRDHVNDEVRQEQQRLDALAGNLQSAIAELKGECVMKDTERFEGLKRQAVEENERQYGAEARRNYGDTAVDEVNARVQGMTEEQWQQAQELSRQIAGRLRRLAPAGDPAGPEAAALADLHRRWLCCYWGQKRYSAQAHRGLARMYLADARFCAYYDAIVPGGTAFLCAAIENHIR